MRHGGDKRGSAADRRRRKQWLLDAFGNGKTAPCAHCGHRLDKDHLEADRIEPGGSYARWNIIPACRTCNVQRGVKPLDPTKLFVSLTD